MFFIYFLRSRFKLIKFMWDWSIENWSLRTRSETLKSKHFIERTAGRVKKILICWWKCEICSSVWVLIKSFWRVIVYVSFKFIIDASNHWLTCSADELETMWFQIECVFDKCDRDTFCHWPVTELWLKCMTFSLIYLH